MYLKRYYENLTVLLRKKMAPARIHPEELSTTPVVAKKAVNGSIKTEAQSALPNSSSSDSHWSANPTPALMHRSLREKPILVEKTSGHYIELQNGNSIMDACGGAAVAIIGHGNQEVISEITKQLSSVAYVHTLAYTTPAAEQLAELLVGDRPGGLCKAFFVGSGSEAIEGALKLARQYFFEIGEPQRIHLIARKQAYHGNTFGSMSISNNESRLTPYKDVLLPNVSHVSPCYPYRYRADDEDDAAYVLRLASELDAEFQRVGPSNVIAFVAETVGGATSGCITPVPGYFQAMKAVCEKYGALFMLDEVMCGMGRTGTYFAWEQENVAPDIMTIGKGLGGGYAPIASILANEKVVAALDGGSGAFNHGHTYQAHPGSCAAALAVQRIVKRDNLVERCAEQGKKLEAALKDRLGKEAHVGEIRGRGLFWGVEFVKDKETKKPFDAPLKFGPTVQKRALDFGIAIYPGAGTIDGYTGDHVLIAPPYTVTDSEIDVIVDTLLKAYKDVVQELA